MSQLKSILGLLLLLIGGVLLYYTLPAYWANFKVNQMIGEQAIIFTNQPKSDEVIMATISQKAQDLSVPLKPEEVAVSRTGGDLTISVAYTTHVDLPVYPFDLNFKNSTTNHNVMK